MNVFAIKNNNKLCAHNINLLLFISRNFNITKNNEKK